jgi:serine/threonine-protein kinase
MADELTVQAAELFKRVLDRPPERRAAFLNEACGEDLELRCEVESLLEFSDQGDEFLEQPAIEIALKSFLHGALKPDQRIGTCKVVAQIGSGGMGEVYLAHDQKLNRQVALKLVRFGTGGEETARHFLREAQILASLNHRNIAQLYGAEIIPDGFSFLIMEYVEGVRIDKYCDDNQLSVRDRLEMFRRVCGAVHYAHQRLIIHRDIKPANILITKEGEPKLLDFGIAKLLDPEASMAGEQTVTFAAAMTPEYASPEQVRGETMTTASDVYSLGVILYELLTGQRPYRIKGRNPAEIARAITEQEPARPSTAIARGSGSSKSQGPNPKILRGDLDNIVLNAMRKESQRRYASVEQFSEDIRRYLGDRPITARKDTFSYRTVKFIKRNKVAVTTATLVVLAIVTGLIVALWQAENARQQRDLAHHERLKAERINTFLQRMLSFSNQSVTSVWPVAQKKDVTVNEMLDRVTPQVEAELTDQPDVRAQVLRTIGSAYASQGRYDMAEKNLRTALNDEIQLYGENNPEVADTMSELGVLSYRQVRYEEANSLLEKAIAAYKTQRQANLASFNPAKLALALDYLAATKLYQVDPYAAKPLMLEALRISSGANLRDKDRLVVAFNKSDTGASMVYTGELEKGQALLHEALTEYRQISNRPQWEQGSTLTHLGAALTMQRQFDEAEKYLIEGERVYRETLGDKSFYLSANLNRQAILFSEKNDLKAAEEKARESLAVARDFSPENRVLWAGPMATLGKVLIKTGQVRQGEDYLRQALAIHNQQTTKNYFNIGNLKIDLSQFLLAQNRWPEAEKLALEAYNETKQNLGNQHPASKAAADNLNKMYQKRGKHIAAEEIK